jgi:hypothetical protein
MAVLESLSERTHLSIASLRNLSDAMAELNARTDVQITFDERYANEIANLGQMTASLKESLSKLLVIGFYPLIVAATAAAKWIAYGVEKLREVPGVFEVLGLAATGFAAVVTGLFIQSLRDSIRWITVAWLEFQPFIKSIRDVGNAAMESAIKQEAAAAIMTSARVESALLSNAGTVGKTIVGGVTPAGLVTVAEQAATVAAGPVIAEVVKKFTLRSLLTAEFWAGVAGSFKTVLATAVNGLRALVAPLWRLVAAVLSLPGIIAGTVAVAAGLYYLNARQKVETLKDSNEKTLDQMVDQIRGDTRARADRTLGARVDASQPPDRIGPFDLLGATTIKQQGRPEFFLGDLIKSQSAQIAALQKQSSASKTESERVLTAAEAVTLQRQFAQDNVAILRRAVSEELTRLTTASEAPTDAQADQINKLQQVIDVLQKQLEQAQKDERAAVQRAEEARHQAEVQDQIRRASSSWRAPTLGTPNF